MIYVAPAARAVTVLHLADAGDQTRCGLPMIATDLWMAVDKRPSDRVCPRCEQTVDTQLALWS